MNPLVVAAEPDLPVDDTSHVVQRHKQKIDEKKKEKSWERHAVWAIPAVAAITVIALGSAYWSSPSSSLVAVPIKSTHPKDLVSGGALTGSIIIPQAGEIVSVLPKTCKGPYYSCMISLNSTVKLPEEEQKNFAYTELWQLYKQGIGQSQFFGSKQSISLLQDTALELSDQIVKPGHFMTLHTLTSQEYHEYWDYIYNLNRDIIDVHGNIISTFHVKQIVDVKGEEADYLKQDIAEVKSESQELKTAGGPPTLSSSSTTTAGEETTSESVVTQQREMRFYICYVGWPKNGKHVPELVVQDGRGAGSFRFSRCDSTFAYFEDAKYASSATYRTPLKGLLLEILDYMQRMQTETLPSKVYQGPLQVLTFVRRG